MQWFAFSLNSRHHHQHAPTRTHAQTTSPSMIISSPRRIHCREYPFIAVATAMHVLTLVLSPAGFYTFCLSTCFRSNWIGNADIDNLWQLWTPICWPFPRPSVDTFVHTQTSLLKHHLLHPSFIVRVSPVCCFAYSFLILTLFLSFPYVYLDAWIGTDHETIIGDHSKNLSLFQSPILIIYLSSSQPLPSNILSILFVLVYNVQHFCNFPDTYFIMHLIP